MKTILIFLIALGATLSYGQCCEEKATAKNATQAEKEFLAEANRMMLQAEGKQACCRTTAEKAVAKGGEGCCNAKEETPKFKVFVRGVGYKFFGCPDSANKGRMELLTKYPKVGPVQPVVRAG